MNNRDLATRLAACTELLRTLCADMMASDEGDDLSVEFGALSGAVCILDMVQTLAEQAHVSEVCDALVEEGLLEVVPDKEPS